MHKITLTLLIASLVGCTSVASKRDTYDAINAEITKAAGESKARAADRDAVSAALLPPLNIEIPKPKQPLEERFSLAFSSVPAQQFFMAIVTGTRYSMLVHPDVSGVISANLKDVTVLEALDAIREQYGYDYKVEGTRIYVKPLTMQTRVFQVNYLTGTRKGTSEIRVISGSISDASSASGGGGAAGASTTTTPTATSQAQDHSKISTTSSTDFWGDLRASLDAIVGSGKEGRSVVISPQSGVVVVRAMWNELRDVEAYLKATHLSVGRQVILEAKILEVQLNDSYQTGVNWAAFRAGSHSSRASGGVISPGTLLRPAGTISGTQIGTNGAGQDLVAASDPAALVGGMFGLAFQSSNFAALLSFLETQGSVHVLSSPRIATLNNQKAVLKVGRDEFFVTNVSTTTTTGTSTTTSPSVTVQPFFSGVALDVTPQIDESGNIILHIHPAVSDVTTVDKPINLGSAGTFSLPLASSAVSETDSIVRGKDGQIVAIGGLMRQAASSDRSQVPVAGNVPVLGTLLGNTNRSSQKRELVILLKPTIVDSSNAWTQDMLESQRRIQALEPRNSLHQRNPLE
ncbi:MAG TPA: pilus (MSHA type) biogenesis protein MshL [Oxalobacteraceae bacterium]|nr:pilus (MSHA type) biogenesis protein MshL [Oxalobacteraceae bacterium]